MPEIKKTNPRYQRRDRHKGDYSKVTMPEDGYDIELDAMVAIPGLLPRTNEKTGGGIIGHFDPSAKGARNHVDVYTNKNAAERERDIILNAFNSLTQGNSQKYLEMETYTNKEPSPKPTLHDLLTPSVGNETFWRQKHCIQSMINWRGLTENMEGSYIQNVLYDPDNPDNPEKSMTDDMRLAYYNRATANMFRSNYHWGQRKLFMAELEFLMDENAIKEDPEVNLWIIYAGALPGHHIPSLIDRFGPGTSTNVLLYDPKQYETRQKKKHFPRIDELWSDKVNKWVTDKPASGAVRKVFDKKMTLEEVTSIKQMIDESKAKNSSKKTKVLFISDIRTNLPEMKNKPSDAVVKTDLDMQIQLTQKLNPDAALLKFRLPWVDRSKPPKSTSYEYMRGRVMLPIWSPPSSTECRLHCNRQISGQNYERKHVYDYHQIEEQMSYFQHILRVATYNPEIKFPVTFTSANKQFTRVPQAQTGYCNCYDCVRDQQIIKRLWQTKIGPDTDEKIAGHIMMTSIAIKQACYKEMHPDVAPEAYAADPSIGTTQAYSEPDTDILPAGFEYINHLHMHK